MMDSKAIEMDTATLAKFSKIFLQHQILWHNNYKYWSWGRRSFQVVFMELYAIFPMAKYDLNEVRGICNKFSDDHLSTLVQMIVSFTKMRSDAYETLQQTPEWLWWLRKEMQEIPVDHNVLKITEFQMQFANSMWQVMVKMYGITEPSSDVNLNFENRTMRVDREISIEHIDCAPLECLMKEYNITKEKLQEIWCRWREVIVAKLSAMSRGDLGMSPLRSVDWSLVDQLLLFDSQVPTLIQEDFEPLVKSLKILFQLVTKHQVEECDPMERKSRWDMLHREYNSSNRVGQKASCVLLQRWWYELKLSTQRAFRKLWQSLKNNGTHRDTPLPETLQCDIALRYRHVVTEELPSWTELVRSGGVVVLMGINGDSTKERADQPSVQPIDINNSVLHNGTVPRVDSTRQYTDTTDIMLSNQSNNDLVTLKRVNNAETHGSVGNENKNNSAQSLLDYLNKVNPAEVKTEITFDSDDEDTISGNNTDDNTKVVNEDHDYCSVGFNDEGLSTLETAYGEDRQNPGKDMNANGKSNYVFSKRLFMNLIKIIRSKNPRIKFERKKRWNPSSSSNSDSDSQSDNDSHLDVSDCSNRSKDADSKFSIDQILMDTKVILTRLEDISVWREKSYKTFVDNDQLHKIHLNSKVLSGLTCSNANYNCGERKRKLKRITSSNKRRKLDSESSVEEVKSLDDKLDDPKEEKNGRVAKKIKLQDVDEIRRINKDILTAQVAPMTVNKAQTAEDSSNKNVDESTNKTSTNEPKIVNVDPTRGNTSKQNNGDHTKEDKRRRRQTEKRNIGNLLCGGNTRDILRFLSRKKEGVKKNGKAPSVRALLKLIDYLNVLYRSRLPSCCQARLARTLVLAHRRILASKNPTRPAPTYRRFAHQHKLLHVKSECTCCCKRVLIETPTPSENDYLAVLSRMGSILGHAANGGVPLSDDGTFKTLRGFTRVFSETKNIKILDNKDSKESKGPIVEPPKKKNKKQSLVRAVDSEKNFEKKKVNHNNADVQKSSNKLDMTNKSFEESYKDWVTEKNKCELLFGYKARNKTNKNTANESKETQTNANIKPSVEYQTMKRFTIVNGVDSPIQTTKMTYEIALTKTNTLENQQEINNETTTGTTDKIRGGILKSLQNEAKNSEREAIHENLNKDFQVPLHRSVNKLGDKSNGEKSENEAVNSKKSTIDYKVALDTSGATSKLEKKSSSPKSTDKIPIKRLKVRSLKELKGMKPVISTDLARSDESKTKESIEQQLNTINKEVINKSQPYIIILDPTVSKNSISQFNNGPPELIFMPETLNFEANQPSTNTQSVQNEAKNSEREAIHELNKDFQVPLDRSVNKLGDKSNGEKSENEAVNSKKSTIDYKVALDTSGATSKLGKKSSSPKSTNKIPIKRLKVRSLMELKGMKPVISTDLARSDESKTKESIEQQLNTIDKEVINKSQPYIIILDPTVSKNSISQFNNGPPELIFMPETLNFEANQPSTNTQSVQNEAKNSEREAIHELNKDFQVPLDLSVNKLGDKSNGEKSENKAVNSKKSTIDYKVALDTSGATSKLGKKSSSPKSTDKIPIKRLKVRSLKELKGMKPVISTDLARSDESKTKESIEQQLNTINKEVINKSQPYIIILDPTVSKNSISQFNNGPPELIFMPETLNFEANQPSTNTQSVQNEAKNSEREAIHELNKDFQVPLDRSVNKLGDKSNGEKSENEAVNSKKSTIDYKVALDTSGATSKLGKKSSSPKSTNKIPIKRLKVRSLMELKGMKPVISTDLARSDESKTKESIEQQLNTIDKEVINKSQPYIIILDPTVSKNSISQFNNGPPELIFMPETLNFEANQPSTNTQSVQNEAKNSEREAIHELNKDFQVPLDLSVNKLGDKSNGEKSENKAVNSKKSTIDYKVALDTSGATSKLGKKSSSPKSTDKIPIKRLKVRSLKELKGMKPVISTDLARSDESKTKESIEQQLNTIDKEVINKSQPYIIISDPTVSENSISQFNNGPPELIFMPETLNFDANQPSTSTQSVQNEIINNSSSCLDSIEISNVVSLKDCSKFNGLSKAPPMSAEQFIVGKDMTKMNILYMDVSKPAWKVGGDYLVVTYAPYIFERGRFFTLCPGAQAELMVDKRGGLFSAPEQIIIEGKVQQKIISSPLTYAAVLFVVPSPAQYRKLLSVGQTVSLFKYSLRDGELHQLSTYRLLLELVDQF